MYIYDYWPLCAAFFLIDGRKGEAGKTLLGESAEARGRVTSQTNPESVCRDAQDGRLPSSRL
jgi:hypothetical protein